MAVGGLNLAFRVAGGESPWIYSDRGGSEAKRNILQLSTTVVFTIAQQSKDSTKFFYVADRRDDRDCTVPTKLIGGCRGIVEALQA